MVAEVVVLFGKDFSIQILFFLENRFEFRLCEFQLEAMKSADPTVAPIQNGDIAVVAPTDFRQYAHFPSKLSDARHAHRDQ